MSPLNPAPQHYSPTITREARDRIIDALPSPHALRPIWRDSVLPLGHPDPVVVAISLRVEDGPLLASLIDLHPRFSFLGGAAGDEAFACGVSGLGRIETELAGLSQSWTEKVARTWPTIAGIHRDELEIGRMPIFFFLGGDGAGLIGSNL
jgi:hypothetical protein